MLLGCTNVSYITYADEYYQLQNDKLTSGNLTPVFDNIDFSTGQYSLYGVFWSDNEYRHKTANTIGQFYIDNVEVLKDIQNTWQFETFEYRYRCGYDYTLYLAKGDSIIEKFSLNIECSSLVDQHANYKIPQNYVDALIGKTKTLAEFKTSYTSRDEAIEAVSMAKQADMYFAPFSNYIWLHHPGFFEFRIKNPGYNKTEAILHQIEDKFKTSFTPNQYSLKNVSLFGEYLQYRVYCDSSLYQNFNGFEIASPYQKLNQFDIMAYRKLND